MITQKLIYVIASVSGFLSVSIGAFGAHGLKTILESNNRLETFNTAVQYMFYHTFALFLTAILMNTYSSKNLAFAGVSFGMGILIFSGSLFALSLTNITKLGAITPIGGLAFLIGWALIFWTVVRG